MALSRSTLADLIDEPADGTLLVGVIGPKDNCEYIVLSRNDREAAEISQADTDHRWFADGGALSDEAWTWPDLTSYFHTIYSVSPNPLATIVK